MTLFNHFEQIPTIKTNTHQICSNLSNIRKKRTNFCRFLTKFSRQFSKNRVLTSKSIIFVEITQILQFCVSFVVFRTDSNKHWQRSKIAVPEGIVVINFSPVGSPCRVHVRLLAGGDGLEDLREHAALLHLAKNKQRARVQHLCQAF